MPQHTPLAKVRFSQQPEDRCPSLMTEQSFSKPNEVQHC